MHSGPEVLSSALSLNWEILSSLTTSVSGLASLPRLSLGIASPSPAVHSLNWHTSKTEPNSASFCGVHKTHGKFCIPTIPSGRREQPAPHRPQPGLPSLSPVSFPSHSRHPQRHAQKSGRSAAEAGPPGKKWDAGLLPLETLLTLRASVTQGGEGKGKPPKPTTYHSADSCLQLVSAYRSCLGVIQRLGFISFESMHAPSCLELSWGFANVQEEPYATPSSTTQLLLFSGWDFKYLLSDMWKPFSCLQRSAATTCFHLLTKTVCLFHGASGHSRQWLVLVLWGAVVWRDRIHLTLGSCPGSYCVWCYSTFGCVVLVNTRGSSSVQRHLGSAYMSPEDEAVSLHFFQNT